MSQPTLFDASDNNESIPSVSDLTYDIKEHIEMQFGDVLVQGEISTLKKSFNGHYYFTLKDENAQLPCVMFRNVARTFGSYLEHGKHVVLGGDIEVYPPHGRYQLIVRLVQEAGMGALQQAFEALKKKLGDEGLFDQEHKRGLPRFPKTIGVVTSSTGAAFQDIRSTLAKRFPLVRVMLYHASVQGDRASKEIAAGIEYFNRKQPVDLLIVGRGGGSMEDLWPFNEERVARAIFASTIPVVSAVGHETDFSISDFVADARAATPTHAATMAVPDRNELMFKVEDLAGRLYQAEERKLQNAREKVKYLSKTYALPAVRQKVEQHRNRIEKYTREMKHHVELKLVRRRESLRKLQYSLESNNPKEPLNRGFTRILQDNKWIRKRGDFNRDEAFEIEWSDGKQSINSQGQ